MRLLSRPVTNAKLKIFVVAFIALALPSAALVGCAQEQDGTEQQADTEQQAQTAPSNEQIKTEQVAWDMGSAVYDGSRRVAFTFTNESELPIANVRMTFKPADDVTDKQLNKAYSSMSAWKAAKDDAIEAIRNNGVWCEVSGMVQPGQQSSQMRLELGYAYHNDVAQYELFQPEFMEITYVYGDRLYTQTYDYVTGAYTLSNEVQDYVEWPDGQAAQAIPQMGGKYVSDVYSNDTSSSFYVHEVLGTEFKEYVAQCEDMGFVESSQTDDSYSADSADGTYELNAYYTADKQQLYISVSAKAQPESTESASTDTEGSGSTES